jgi:hypothetical protein
MVVSVLLKLKCSGILDEYPNLAPARRSAARLQAGFRRLIGGFHRCIEWLTKVRTGFKQT